MIQQRENVIDEQKNSTLETFIWSGIGRAIFVLLGIVLPIVCFAYSFTEGTPTVGTLWQDGQLSTYARLMTSFPPAGLFYPFLAYSMASLGLLVLDRTKFENYLAVRFGIYSGVVLSVQFHGILFPANSVLSTVLFALGAFLAIVLTTACGLLIIIGLQKLVRRFIGISGKTTFAILLVICVLVGIGVNGFRVFGGVFLFALMLSTTLSTAVYCVVSFYLFRRPSELRFRLFQAFGLFSWLAVYMAAWRQSIRLAIIQYQQLPTENSGCYVCSAAAKGHKQFVKSSLYESDGLSIQVNDQLRTLKAFEVSLRTSAPVLHRILRRIYDAIGPWLADRLTTPWLADLAYASLKPLEWLANFSLYIIGVDSRHIDNLYRQSGIDRKRSDLPE